MEGQIKKREGSSAKVEAVFPWSEQWRGRDGEEMGVGWA